MGGTGSGRPGRPNHLKVLEGAPESAINRDEPTPAAATIKAPSGMRAKARAVWRRLAPDLEDKGVLTAWDVDAFAVVCEAIALRTECIKKIHDPDDPDSGLTARGAAGGIIPNPLFKVVRDCNNDIARFGARFGLTPSDRARLVVGGSDAPRELGAERLLS